MTVDASRSCLGLGTCVGSATRQIVDARVLLTVTAPPALPSNMPGGSLASPCDAITGFLAISIAAICVGVLLLRSRQGRLSGAAWAYVVRTPNARLPGLHCLAPCRAAIGPSI